VAILRYMPAAAGLACSLALLLSGQEPAENAKAGKGGKGKAAKAAPTKPSEPTPRWPDGHVNLGSTSAYKGYWEVRPGLGGFPRADTVPFQPWARALYNFRQSATALYPPLVNCKPASGPSFFNAPGFEFVEVPEMKQMLILNIAGPHSWRVVYMDGRPHPPKETLRPAFFGHSTGKWEGDTLVIDTIGFNEKQWLTGSYPTTNQLHLIERVSRPNLRTLSYEVTIDDPGAYTATWSGKWTINETTASNWVAGGEMFEYICQDSGR
jgi:hypothetical protein